MLGDRAEFQGKFWLPSDAEHRVSGTLVCHAGRFELSLIGTFDRSGFVNPALDRADIILGATNGGNCTLLRTHQTNAEQKFFSRGIHVARTTFAATYVFVGNHFESGSDVEFAEMEFGFDLLEAWVGHHPFSSEREETEAGRRVALARHVFEEPFEIRLADAAATIRLNHTLSERGELFRSFTWEQRAGLRLQPDTPQAWTWFEQQLSELRRLLTLLCGEPAVLERALGRSRDAERLDTEVFVPDATEPRRDRAHPVEMLLPRDALGDDLPAVFSSWFEKRDLLQTAAGLYFGTLYNPRAPLEFQFLALTQALESLHRRLVGGQYVSDEEYAAVADALVAALPSSAPAGLRDSLKARLQYGNELSQRRRFKELVDLVGRQAAVLVDLHGDFVQRVVAQRNYLTHDVPDGRYPPMDLGELYRYVLRLRAFTAVLLLREIGVDPARSVEAIRKLRWFRSFVA